MFKITQFKLESELLRILLEDDNDNTVEKVEIKNKGKWNPIIGSFPGLSVLTLYKVKNRILKN